MTERDYLPLHCVTSTAHEVRSVRVHTACRQPVHENVWESSIALFVGLCACSASPCDPASSCPRWPSSIPPRLTSTPSPTSLFFFFCRPEVRTIDPLTALWSIRIFNFQTILLKTPCSLKQTNTFYYILTKNPHKRQMLCLRYKPFVKGQLVVSRKQIS